MSILHLNFLNTSHNYLSLNSACGSGYFGPNCSHACPYPKYGRRCLKGECRCPEPICDPVAGCAISKYKNVIIISFYSYAYVIY